VTGVAEKRAQTAIQGVAFAAAVNLLSKVLLYLRQMVIAAVFGLSAWLDAFFVATSFVSIFITVFGDIFDSAGILPNVAIGVAIATTAAWFLPGAPTAWLDVGARGLLFVMCYLAILLFAPGGELRRVRRIVFESFPSLHRRFERYC
jgi:hypothetical protein